MPIIEDYVRAIRQEWPKFTELQPQITHILRKHEIDGPWKHSLYRAYTRAYKAKFGVRPPV